jgi:type IV pili sensor histidine kinase/response regulator
MLPINRCFLSAVLLSSLSILGCQSVEPLPVTPVPESKPESTSELYVPVHRYSRYTLAELKPEATKQNLLMQVIEIELPGTWDISVAEALRHVLLRSGYRLCERSAQSDVLYELPLPAAHLKLGPITLRDALLTLSGPAWLLNIDEQLREVCFLPAIPSVVSDLPERQSHTSESDQ